MRGDDGLLERVPSREAPARPRDPSGLLHASRVYVGLRVLKKRRQPDMKQMKCKLSGVRRETLEIRSDKPERAVRE